MKVETLQTRLTAAREKLLAAIADLPEEALLAPGAVGTWSIADLLANLATWEAELVTGLAEIQRRKKPSRLLAAIADREAYDARRYAENQDRELDLIFDDLQGARIQLEVRLEDLVDRDLNDPRRFRWLKGKPLGPLLAELSYEYELSFLPAVQAYVQRWEATQAAAMNQIDLTDIEVNNGTGG